MDITNSECTILHSLFGSDSISASNHLHKSMSLVFINDAGLHLAMAVEDGS